LEKPAIYLILLSQTKKAQMKAKLILSLSSILGFSSLIFSQNNVGIGTNTPNSTAALEVTSPTNNQGVLVPRITTVDRLGIVSPANGLLVYDTNFDCFFYYIAASATWQSMCSGGGATGPTGPTGAAGANGTAGAAGATGPTGANGTNGISCWDLNGDGVNDPAEDINGDAIWNALDCAGANGATGAAGAAGATGATGAAGASGTNGINGLDGVHCWDSDGDGVNDPAEDTNGDGSWNTLDCVAGVVGPTGPTGLSGPAGPTGPAGANGVNGTNGTNGTNGATGATGAAGTNGATGPTGPTGPAGANGTNGTNGTAGATGPTGPAGANGTNGTNGTAGATGPTGPAGANGTNGTNGAVGATGPTGAAGATGPTGANGTNGAVGATGPTGAAGAAGATGAAGAAGATGPTGAAGATGPTGPNWTISSDNFNTDGSLSIVTTIPSTVTSTQMAWLLGGNATTALRQMGSTGAQPVNFITTNVERYRMTAGGQIVVNNTTAGAGDLFSAYGTGYAGAIQSTAGVNDWPISGYATGTNGGIYGENTGTGTGVYGNATGATSGTGVYGQNGGTANGSDGVFGNYTGTTGLGMGVRGQATTNATASIGVGGFNTGTGTGVYGTSTLGQGVWGVGTAGADGTVGQTNNAAAFGLWGINTNVTGTGCVAAGTNSTSFYLTTGTGGAFGGRRIGVYGRAVQDSTLGGVMKAGGYFYSNINSFVYVGAVTTANVIRKIEGTGTVNTVVRDLSGQQVVLSAPEAPENLFEDYGTGQLYGGNAHITLDPVLTKNIVVNEQHPLRVFIQLEGDCKGVYVSNKTANGFDVNELMNGNSNVKFSWHVVANRADEVMNDGSISKYSDERFAPAIGPQEQRAAENKITPNVEPINGPVKQK
jgi:hypothetical protein